uniref:Uncharacterized protein n=1 Tax=Romanomermis culicivorax TaxID=13658 RepID=A0A915K2Q1_ROMCU
MRPFNSSQLKTPSAKKTTDRSSRTALVDITQTGLDVQTRPGPRHPEPTRPDPDLDLPTRAHPLPHSDAPAACCWGPLDPPGLFACA